MQHERPLSHDDSRASSALKAIWNDSAPPDKNGKSKAKLRSLVALPIYGLSLARIQQKLNCVYLFEAVFLCIFDVVFNLFLIVSVPVHHQSY